ncbi:zinc-binding dehydrogenase [bacterium]|nr:zinc-binding dehydrogenase [bacterium]
MKALYFTEHGGAEKLSYGEIQLGPLPPGFARVRVHSVALNHLDIWIRRGWPGLNLSLPHITGADICGVVSELGEDSGEGSASVGDRVTVYPGVYGPEDEFILRGEPSVSPQYRVLGEHLWGGLAEYVDVPIENLEKPHSSFSDDQAAALNLVVTTSWRMLFSQGKLQERETVLIVGSGGGVNIAAALICVARGHEVFMLAGGAEKVRKAKALGVAHVIDYTAELEWQRAIMKLTGGRGVDLVIDNVGASTFQRSLKSLVRGGRLVTVGNTSGPQVNLDNRLLFGKQLSIIGSTMGSREDWQAGLHFFAEHGLSLPLEGVFPLSQGKQQLQKMENGEHFGKIVLQPGLAT